MNRVGFGMLRASHLAADPLRSGVGLARVDAKLAPDAMLAAFSGRYGTFSVVRR
jgi:hypothetical protein